MKMISLKSHELFLHCCLKAGSPSFILLTHGMSLTQWIDPVRFTVFSTAIYYGQWTKYMFCEMDKVDMRIMLNKNVIYYRNR